MPIRTWVGTPGSVTLNEHEVAGELEVLYTQEPEPFGRYAHLEILELAEGLDTYEIEDWLIGQCEERARSRGYYRFWCRPEGSGGQVPVLQRRGYTELWRNAHLRLRSLDTFQPPRHRTRLLRGDYSTEASHLLALNHRESAEYRWRYLWRPVLSPEASDFPIDVSFWGAHVTTEAGVAGVCLVNIWRWRDPKVASADIWIDPSAINETESVSGLVAIAAGRASEMGAETLDLYAPEALTPKLTRENVELLPLDEMGDPWLCKELSKIN